MNLELVKFPSHREFISCMESSTERIIVLRSDETPREYFCLIVLQNAGGSVRIGIESYGMGLVPEWVEFSRYIVVGFNRSIAFIDKSTFDVSNELDLSSLFFYFHTEKEHKTLFIICETAFVAVDVNGSVLYRIDTDIIVDAKFLDNSVELLFMDDKSINIDLHTGLKS